MFIQNLLEQPEFAELLGDHCAEMVAYFMDEGIEFGILCNLADVEFQDKLPEDIYSALKPLTLFMVAGYSFESAMIRDDLVLEFEAGFGRENFGTVVQVPLNSILQLMIGDTVVFVNLTATLPKRRKESPDKGSEERSLDAIFSNPENENLFKK